MKSVILYPINGRVRYSSFTTDTGCEEFFLTVSTAPGSEFPGALTSLEDDYEAFLKESSLSDTTAVFSRLFVSDFVNQRERFDRSSLVKRLKSGALSIIEEKPVGEGMLSLFSYHIRNPYFPGASSQSVHLSGEYRNTAFYSGKNYSLLMTANYSDNEVFDGYRQTRTIFRDIQATIEKNNMRLLDNTVRTWIFVRDVDNHYNNAVIPDSNEFLPFL